MEVTSLTQSSQSGAKTGASTGQAAVGDEEFAAALSTAQSSEDEGNGEAASESSADAGQDDAADDPRTLRQQRLERFGSYTAYSLWRKIPAMAAGIVEAKSDSYFEEHGLLEYWQNKRDHFQGLISGMSVAERAASGTRLLDQDSASVAIQNASDASTDLAETSADVEPDGTAQAETAALDEAEASIQEPITEDTAEAVETSDAATASSEQTSSAETTQAEETVAAVNSAASGQGTATAGGEQQVEVTDTSSQEPLLAADQTSSAEVAQAEAPEEAGSGAAAEGIQDADEAAAADADAAASSEAGKSQAELRAERLERFGSYTAYSLWRKIPAMAAGIVEAKPDSYFEEHGLLEYWQNKRDHFQGLVSNMSIAERAASGTSLINETGVVQAAISESTAAAIGTAAAADSDSEGDAASSPVVEQSATTAAAAETSPEDGVQETTEPTTQTASETTKSQAELRAERLERFGSYTAYSLWRKIPAMAAGIVEAKPDSYFEEHGLLEYWQNKRDHFQSLVANMSEAERSAAGVSLLGE